MLTEPFEIDQTNNLVVAAIHASELDAEEAQELVSQLSQRMRYDNAQFFILDMGEVQFLYSACLGLLVMFVQDLEPQRGRIALANCQPNVVDLLKVTRLDALMSLYDDVETARTEVAGG